MSVIDRVTEYMSPNPLTLHTDDRVAEVRHLFVQNGFTVAPVVDAAGNLCGVVSASDVLNRAEDEQVPLEEIMSTSVVTVPESRTVVEAAEVMNEADLHHVVVVDGGREPIGVFSTVDVCRALADTDVRQPIQWVMTSEVVAFDAGTTLQEARAELEDSGITAAVVVSGGSPIGVASQLALLRAEEEADEGTTLETVGEALDTRFRLVPLETPIGEAARLVAEEEVRHLLVHDEDLDIVGIVTATDLAGFVGRLEDIEAVEPVSPLETDVDSIAVEGEAVEGEEEER